MRMRLFCCLVLAGCVVATACTPSAAPPASTTQGQAGIKALAREALARRDRMTPEPYPCGSGWTETPAGYVVAVPVWAEQAGLRPGDRIVSVGGASPPRCRCRAGIRAISSRRNDGHSMRLNKNPWGRRSGTDR
jgi:membrane-associated protease RseP (regulator of RpoE activity)